MLILSRPVTDRSDEFSDLINHSISDCLDNGWKVTETFESLLALLYDEATV